MKSHFINSILPLTLTLVCSLSCSDDTFEGSDTVVEITREFPSFKSVSASTDLFVKVATGNDQLVKVMVNENLQDQLKTEVSGDELNISLADGSFENATFIVDITLPELKSLELNDNTKAEVSFTGDHLDLAVSGSSSLEISGVAQSLGASVSAVGTIQGFGLETDSVIVNAKDASSLEITCLSSLEGSVEDAAIVRYRGTPTIEVQTSDAGQVLDGN